MATMDEMHATCERCGRTIPLVVVDSDDDELTAAQQAAVEVYQEWFERFDPELGAYVCRCPGCVEEAERGRWIRIGDPEFADHTAPDYRRSEPA